MSEKAVRLVDIKLSKGYSGNRFMGPSIRLVWSNDRYQNVALKDLEPQHLLSGLKNLMMLVEVDLEDGNLGGSNG